MRVGRWVFVSTINPLIILTCDTSLLLTETILPYGEHHQTDSTNPAFWYLYASRHAHSYLHAPLYAHYNLWLEIIKQLSYGTVGREEYHQIHRPRSDHMGFHQLHTNSEWETLPGFKWFFNTYFCQKRPISTFPCFQHRSDNLPNIGFLKFFEHWLKFRKEISIGDKHTFPVVCFIKKFDIKDFQLDSSFGHIFALWNHWL